MVYLDPEGTAAGAGLKVGDVIMEVEGEVMEKITFLRRVASLPADSSLSLKVLSEGQARTVPVKVGALKRRNPARTTK